MAPHTRRQAIRLAVASVAAGVVGCIGGADRQVSPKGDPSTVTATLDCDREGVERLDSPYYETVVWGGGDDTPFTLRVDALEYERGDEVTITMRNDGDEAALTGNERKFNLELNTEGGWQDVRVWDGDRPVGYTAIGIEHPPGEGFEWTFPLTPEGFPEQTDDRFTVCPGFPEGRYRFVYWGTDPALAVAFDLVDGGATPSSVRS
ncbi:hypothetical protein BV210_11955 [Halorientalis sp. IM1011]|uniref:immunoglobulin-like domain-containing protein n=1 Tax=Halorientalis sp. IM1011 TaxID=1932360 RepID=UPI00097CC9AE|nr:immunoglobulin-like domain-containing protein [Halorientalis sp. IM1011]AQL43360.1 hypothetical protein BV210_11955 [Halorientalis sp. IM1011]